MRLANIARDGPNQALAPEHRDVALARASLQGGQLEQVARLGQGQALVVLALEKAVKDVVAHQLPRRRDR